MRLGLVGLGSTTMEIARQLMRHGHEVVVYDRDLEKMEQLVKQGAERALYLAGLVEKLPAPRAVLLTLPSGNVMDDYIEILAGLLSPDDVIIDASDCHHWDATRRADMIRGRFVHYLDLGIIKDVCGLEKAYCFSVGGQQKIANRFKGLFQCVTLRNCYLHSGPVGAGHLVQTTWYRMNMEPSQRKCSIPFSIKGYKCERVFDCPELKQLKKLNSFVRCRSLRDAYNALLHNLPHNLQNTAVSTPKAGARPRDIIIPLFGARRREVHIV